MDDRLLISLTLSAALALLPACHSSSSSGGDDDTGTDSDSDTDTDVDSGTNIDSDTDSDLCLPDEVHQPATDLCWWRCPLGQTWNGVSCDGGMIMENWCDATGWDSAECEPESFGESACIELLGSEYRLPTVDEFLDLLENCADEGNYYDCDDCDGGDYGTTCNEMFGDDAHAYWSRTAIDGFYAWSAAFASGLVGEVWVDELSHIRCVRSGP